MYVVRNVARKPVQLQARLEIAGNPGSGRQIPARTLDLSTHGIGLITHHLLPAGEIVVVTIEDGEPGISEERSRKRWRRWRGHVVYSESGSMGRRLGICFDEPEFGPQITFEVPTTNRGARRFRLDGPSTMDSPEPDLPAHAGVASSKPMAGSRPFRTAALIGLGLDQVLKAICAPATSEASQHQPASTADWQSLVMTVVGLGAAGMLVRLAERAPNGERSGVSCGVGLILGALLSGLVDRLAFGDVRTIGSWSITPAHLLAATGAVMAAGSMLIPGTTEPKKNAVGTVTSRFPARPGSTGLGC